MLCRGGRRAPADIAQEEADATVRALAQQHRLLPRLMKLAIRSLTQYRTASRGLSISAHDIYLLSVADIHDCPHRCQTWACISPSPSQTPMKKLLNSTVL